ncbi:DDE-type integrase/transposase/recombinase, partial [Nonomuraea sp. NPDC052265]|uniref:DDE-type integrase/transposase/recombinase n=1 Tax=Nonomuraea sp. NPDC052265 TaxID=3364374 RepID=UPI0037CAF40C
PQNPQPLRPGNRLVAPIKRPRCLTTNVQGCLTRQGKRPAALDLVRRKFAAVAADALWVGDVTMITTDEGPLYLASVEDLFSRRLLGYAMSEHHDAALTVASLQMAVVTRGGDVDGEVRLDLSARLSIGTLGGA